MLRLEKQYKGEPQIAYKMLAHFPGKTNKQIRDKKEKTYKNLVQAQMNTTITTGAEDDNSPLACTPRPTIPVMNTPAIKRTEVLSEHIDKHSAAEVGRSDVAIATEDIHWINRIIEQTLSESSQDVTNDDNLDTFRTHITALLRKVSKTNELPTQTAVDDVYQRLVTVVRPQKTRKTISTTRQRRGKDINAVGNGTDTGDTKNCTRQTQGF
jgi:hypothetical protein